ncbi:MAG: hypothetical protein IPM66_05400 [Acidobacteriota bacterium]|nr:MAG: hypothetical protein IPM66_05400 [Acidobacteriota bacterium]
MVEKDADRMVDDESISQQESREAIARVLASRYFVNAPMKQKFLTTICEFQLTGRGEELNEFLIGHEVFGRDESYNPATDPIVRVSAHGVRYKLESYYHDEGVRDAVRIELPPGKYAPRFIRNEPAPVEAVEKNGQSGRSSQKSTEKSGNILSWPMIVIPALLLIIGALGYSNYQYRVGRGANQESPEIYNVFWGGLLENASPTLIVLSNPAVFRFINAGDPKFIVDRGIPLTPEETAAVTGRLRNKNLLRITPSSSLTLTSDIYTGLGEAMGLYNLAGVFRAIGKNFLVKQSRTVSAEDLKHHNVIILGTVWVNDWSGKLPLAENFEFTDQVTIRNLNPRDGERKEYKAVFRDQTGEIIEDYALITVGRNISGNEWFMLVGGLHSEGTAAAAEYLTNPYYLKNLNLSLESQGRPRYFQALLRVGVENAIPTTISLESIHPLK